MEVLRDPVREALRNGVRRGVLCGWYTHASAKGTMWVITLPAGTVDQPCATKSRTYDDAGIAAYCEMLELGGSA